MLCAGGMLLLIAGVFWGWRMQVARAPLPNDLSEHLHLLLNKAHTLFYSDDLDGNVTYISPNCRWLLGYEQNELIGRPSSNLVHPDDLPLCMEFLKKLDQTQTAQNGLVYRIIHKEGTPRWYQGNMAPVLNKKGQITAYVGCSLDITDLTETKRALQESNEELSRLVEEREKELQAAIHQALTAAESEARRIGEHIHDELCQELIALARFSDTAHLPKESRCDRCNQLFDRFHNQALRLADIARTYSHHLAFFELDAHSLTETLHTLSAQIERLSDASVEINISSQRPPPDTTVTNHLYRIVRECTMNALAHGNARQIWIDVVEEPGLLIVSVTNNGHPLPEPDAIISGLGSQQIEMRTRLLGGSFSLTGQPDGKTVAELKIPIETEELS